MDRLLASRPFALIVTILLLAGGVALAAWAVSNIPGRTPAAPSQTAAEQSAPPATDAPARSEETPDDDAPPEDDAGSVADEAAPEPTATPADPELLVTLGAGVPAPAGRGDQHLYDFQYRLSDLHPPQPQTAELRLDIVPAGGTPVYTETFAAATRFDEPRADVTWRDLRDSWRGRNGPYATVVVLSDTLPSLIQALGEPAAGVPRR